MRNKMIKEEKQEKRNQRRAEKEEKRKKAEQEYKEWEEKRNQEKAEQRAIYLVNELSKYGLESLDDEIRPFAENIVETIDKKKLMDKSTYWIDEEDAMEMNLELQRVQMKQNFIIIKQLDQLIKRME